MFINCEHIKVKLVSDNNAFCIFFSKINQRKKNIRLCVYSYRKHVFKTRKIICITTNCMVRTGLEIFINVIFVITLWT